MQLIIGGESPALSPQLLSREATQLNLRGSKLIDDIEALDESDLPVDPELLTDSIEQLLDRVDGLVAGIMKYRFLFEGADGPALLSQALASMGSNGLAGIREALEGVRNMAGLAALH